MGRGIADHNQFTGIRAELETPCDLLVLWMKSLLMTSLCTLRESEIGRAHQVGRTSFTIFKERHIMSDVLIQGVISEGNLVT